MGQQFQVGVGDDADLGILQRNGVDLVAEAPDAVQADHLAAHLETGDLFAAVLGSDAGLEEARPHRVDRFEAVTGLEQALPAQHPATQRHQAAVDAFQFRLRQAERQADLLQVAARTGHHAGIAVRGPEYGTVHGCCLLRQS